MKILSWDLETTPLRAYTWGLWKQNIPYQAVDRHKSIICGCWKWLGDKKVHHTIITDPSKPYEDKETIQPLHEALSEADILVGHNGDKYDLKFFNTRAIVHGFDPIPPIKSVDTLKVAKKHFLFPSNKLDFIGQFIAGDRKIETSLKLWLEIVEDVPLEVKVKALNKMLRYCKQDVRLLEEVYLKMRPYMDNHPNLNLLSASDDMVCRNCGSSNLKKNGTRMNLTTLNQRYICGDCGASCSGTTAIKKVDIK